ncbi:Uncharacterized protein Fot_06540 [Forsythia ovata]|uniref:Uncharacterized protein n=1 Tax=Forsythia ovata TaxID=205694 RepID=A0ABD1WTK6_9LAMI
MNNVNTVFSITRKFLRTASDHMFRRKVSNKHPKSSANERELDKECEIAFSPVKALEVGINSKKLKRKTSTSGNRTKRSKNSVQEDFEKLENVRNASIEFNAHSADPPQSNPTGAFDGASNSRSFTGDGKNKQDLKSQLNDLSGNVQNMIADFLNQIGKKFHSNTEDVVLNRQIVQVEDNDGSQLKDFEVESQVQYDRKGKGKAVVCDKTKNESVYHGAIEFEVEGPKKNLIDEAVVSQKMYNMINFSPSFDLGIDLDTTAFDIELYDMEFTDHDLKMIDETIYMRNMSTSKMAEKIEQDDIIQIDDITPSVARRRTRKTAAVYRSSYISEFVSSGKSKAVIREIKSCTSTLRGEINDVDVNDIVDFEE